jgi:hypothetical protein
VYKLKREGIGGSADLEWVELKGGDALSGSRQSSSDFIDVFIGSGIVRVKPYFDRVLFADICKSLRELC